MTEESFGYDDFETSMEGTTYDSIKIGMSKDKKDADKLFKSAKKNCKDGKYSDAIKDIEKAKSIYNKLEKELSKLDDDMAGTVCSSLLTGFPLSEIYAICSGVGQSSMHKKNIVSYVVGALASTVGNAVGGVGVGSMAGKVARIGAQVIDSKSGEPKNPTKAKTIECMREAVKQCDAIIAEIKKAKKGVKESAGLYADDEEINDQYKSSFNNTRTTKDLYADDEEIKDVGVYEEDELDLTDLDDDIEGSCKEKCGTSSESADMYADNQEINDQYKSSPNIQRTGNNNYADNQEIKDVGVYEDDDLDLTDLDDDIECGNNCGSALEFKGEAERAHRARNNEFGNPNSLYHGSDRGESGKGSKKYPSLHEPYGNSYTTPAATKADAEERIKYANMANGGDRRAEDFKAISKSIARHDSKAHEEAELDLTAEEAFELELLEANLYADDEPVEDKYKTSPSGKIEHEDFYADNQEIKDVSVYESDNKDETAEVDEADPGEDLAEESLLDLLDI